MGLKFQGLIIDNNFTWIYTGYIKNKISMLIGIIYKLQNTSINKRY